ncbi:MAG: anti-sigma factor family protein [Phycisphaerae bacterium]
MTEFDHNELGEWLTAYLDNELEPDQRTVVEKVLAESQEARNLLEELQGVANTVATLPRHPAPDVMIDDIRLQLERQDLLGEEGVPLGTTPERTGWSAFSRWSLAAALGFVAVGGMWAIVASMDQSSTPVVAVNKPIESEADAMNLAESRQGSAESTAATANRRWITGDDARLVSVLNFEQKLEAGLASETLQTHAFKNERMRLSLQARNATDQASFSREILSQLPQMGFAALATDEITETKGKQQAVGRVFLAGKKGRNYSEDGTQQFLVRIPAAEVPALYEKLQGLAPSEDQIAFQMESRTFSGRSRVAPTIQNVFGPEDVVAQPGKAEQTATKGKTDPATNRYGIFERVVTMLQSDSVSNSMATTDKGDKATQSKKSEVPTGAKVAIGDTDTEDFRVDGYSSASSERTNETMKDAADQASSPRSQDKQDKQTAERSRRAKATRKPATASPSDAKSARSRAPLVERRLNSLARGPKASSARMAAPSREPLEGRAMEWVTLVIEVNNALAPKSRTGSNKAKRPITTGKPNGAGKTGQKSKTNNAADSKRK